MGLITIDGQNGNDRIKLKSGNDYNGRFVANGGEGNDQLVAKGSTVRTELRGGAGNDKLIGSEATDLLFGGAGRDKLRGFGGNDYLAGGRGADALFGGSGDDLMTGGKGRDRIDGGAGTDVVSKFTNKDSTVTDSQMIFGNEVDHIFAIEELHVGGNGTVDDSDFGGRRIDDSELEDILNELFGE